jgi:hypothetical protein
VFEATIGYGYELLTQRESAKALALQPDSTAAREGKERAHRAWWRIYILDILPGLLEFLGV